MTQIRKRRTEERKPKVNEEKGRPTDYEDHYPELLVKIMSEGKSFVAFCCVVNIGKTTFYQWLDKHKEFDEAYELGQAKAQSWWEQTMQDNLATGSDEKFNTAGWSLVMKNRFSHTDQRKIKVKGIAKAKSLAAKFEVLAGMLERGELTASESSQLTTFLTGGAKLLESSEMLAKMERLEDLLSQRGDDNASTQAETGQD